MTRRNAVALLLLAVLAFPACGRVAGRTVSRRVARRSAARSAGRILARDARRDALTAARPLARPRTFQRYVPAGGLRRELRAGIPAGRHMAPARVGAPLGSRGARYRYGLPAAPRYRETLRVESGVPFKLNRALGGNPGFGEAVTTRPLPPTAIIKYIKLR